MSFSSHCVSVCVHMQILPRRYACVGVCVCSKVKQSQNTSLLEAEQSGGEIIQTDGAISPNKAQKHTRSAITPHTDVHSFKGCYQSIYWRHALPLTRQMVLNCFVC